MGTGEFYYLCMVVGTMAVFGCMLAMGELVQQPSAAAEYPASRGINCGVRRSWASMSQG